MVTCIYNYTHGAGVSAGHGRRIRICLYRLYIKQNIAVHQLQLSGVGRGLEQLHKKNF